MSMTVFAPGTYAGTSTSTGLLQDGFYRCAVFARVYVASGTPSKTVVDTIGTYGGAQTFDHAAAIPANGSFPHTNVSWWWVGLVSGKPRIWMHDGRYVLNQYGQPRNLFPSGLNGGSAYEFLLDGPDALTTAVCHDVCWQWSWNATVLNGVPSACNISVDGVEVASYDFPDWLGGQPGWYEAADFTKLTRTIGGTRDTAAVIPDSGTIALGEVFLCFGTANGSMVSSANIMSYHVACPGPAASPSATHGYPLDGPSDLSDSIGSEDLTAGGVLTSRASCPCADDPGAMPYTPEIPENNSAECCASPGVEGSGVVAPGAGVELPVLLSAAWTGRCDGGGAVDLLADLTDAEDWSDS